MKSLRRIFLAIFLIFSVMTINVSSTIMFSIGNIGDTKATDNDYMTITNTRDYNIDYLFAYPVRNIRNVQSVVDGNCNRRQLPPPKGGGLSVMIRATLIGERSEPISEPTKSAQLIRRHPMVFLSRAPDEDADVRRKKYIHLARCSTSWETRDPVLNKDSRRQETVFRS